MNKSRRVGRNVDVLEGVSECGTGNVRNVWPTEKSRRDVRDEGGKRKHTRESLENHKDISEDGSINV